MNKTRKTSNNVDSKKKTVKRGRPEKKTAKSKTVNTAQHEKVLFKNEKGSVVTKATVSEYKNVTYVDIRQYLNGDTPTRKGISIPVDKIDQASLKLRNFVKQLIADGII